MTTDQSLIGKRVIVNWSSKAFDKGADWPAFRVLDVCVDGYFCQGIDSPDGTMHDGSKAFIREDEILFMTEWKEEKP